MSTDTQFVATGSAATGFKTEGTQHEVGADLHGRDFGAKLSSDGVALLLTSSGNGLSVVAKDIGVGVLASNGIRVRGATVGLDASASGDDASAVRGAWGGASGFIAGCDPVFRQITGVYGAAPHLGVFGQGLDGGTGLYGFAQDAGFGARAETRGGTAFRAQSFGTGLAVEVIGNATFSGDVTVSGDILLPNADCAEDFDVAAEVAPGTVMVIGPDGALRPCDRAEDPAVAGVVSGAGTYRPALTLDRRPRDGHGPPRQPIALVGKAFCLVDAAYGAVRAGDLLTTSPSVGHAMRAPSEGARTGTVVGKALAPFVEGTGLVPILVTSR